jgi:hypothetical protein
MICEIVHPDGRLLAFLNKPTNEVFSASTQPNQQIGTHKEGKLYDLQGKLIDTLDQFMSLVQATH